MSRPHRRPPRRAGSCGAPSAFFLINLAGLIGEVIVNSLGTRWFDTWLPEGLTFKWYSDAWRRVRALARADRDLRGRARA